MSAADVVCPLPQTGATLGLRHAMDPDWVRAAIRERLLVAGDVVSCGADYVRFKGDQGAVVGWRVGVEHDGGEQMTYVTARVAPKERLASEAARFANHEGDSWSGLRWFSLCHDHEVLLLAFPADRAMRDLRRTLRASRIRRQVLEACPDFAGAGRNIAKEHSRCHLVRYKPERRAVLRWDLALADATGPVASSPVFVRIHATGVARGAAAALRAAAQVGVACPEPLAVPFDFWAVERGVPGTPAPPAPEVLRAAGAALALLHSAPPPGLPLHCGVRELDAVLRSAEALGELHADLGGQADELADRLARWVPPSSSPHLVHGDFHRGQMLVENGRLWLVDFDRAALGHPGLDLAALFAHELDRGVPAAHEAAAAVVDGYRASGGGAAPERELAWYRAAAVVKRAVAPFRALDPQWPALAAAHLDCAQQELARAGL